MTRPINNTRIVTRILLIFLFFSLQIITSHAEKISCHAQKKGALHKLEIEKLKSKIQSISYKSITTNETESTCEIFASQSDSPIDSIWNYQEKKGFFTIKIPNQINEKEATEIIYLKETSTAIYLQLLNSSKAQVHNMECGLNGYLSPLIVLRKGKSICEFE